MINRNGGYAIVDLKGKMLSDTPTTILGTHSAIAKAIAGSKPILLTGLTTGGPCFVQISVDGTSYVISGVYGNDITVTSADAVTSAAVSGGGLLSFAVVTSPGIFTFHYEPGMTFAQFVASDYNIDDVCLITENQFYIGEFPISWGSEGSIIDKDQDITTTAAGSMYVV